MLSDEPDRKLAAIMAADMVGYSRRVRLDEVGTLRRFDAARRDVIEPAIAAHRGRLFKQMGDGFLVEFPSAVLALRCAVVIQSRLANENRRRPVGERIEFRIGVHQGEVVISEDDLLGDGVNVAARLEPLAETGGICISQRVHEDSLGKIQIEVDDLGEMRLKNIDRAVHVLRVRPPGARPHRAAPEGEDETAMTLIAAGIGGGADADKTMVRPTRIWRHRLIVEGRSGTRREISLGPQPLTIGRMPPADLILADPEVSRRHCRIDVTGSEALLADLGSTNGTFVNGRKLDAPALLDPDTRIGIGGHLLVYERLLDIDQAVEDTTEACDLVSRA